MYNSVLRRLRPESCTSEFRLHSQLAVVDSTGVLQERLKHCLLPLEQQLRFSSACKVDGEIPPSGPRSFRRQLPQNSQMLSTCTTIVHSEPTRRRYSTMASTVSSVAFIVCRKMRNFDTRIPMVFSTTLRVLLSLYAYLFYRAQWMCPRKLLRTLAFPVVADRRLTSRWHKHWSFIRGHHVMTHFRDALQCTQHVVGTAGARHRAEAGATGFTWFYT